MFVITTAAVVVACSSSGGASASPPGPGSGSGAPAANSQPAAGSSAGGSPAAGGDCVTGGTVTEINGKTARVFCGPATATVTSAGKTLEFKEGACEFLGDTLTINLGTAMPGETGGPDYFGLTAFGIDTLPLTEMPAITWTKDGASEFMKGDPMPTLTISDDQKTVEFSGSAGGGEASGVIHC
jgi:hypothetical protein